MAEDDPDARRWWAATDESGRPVFVLTGDVDLATAATLRSDLRRWAAQHDDGAHLVLDVAGVTFLDSTGLRALVAVRVAEPGRSVVLRNPSVAVRTVVDIAVPDLFAIEDGGNGELGADGADGAG